MKLEDYPLALTTTQVGEILGIGRKRAWELVRNGTLPGYYLGGARAIRVPRDAVAEWLSQGSVSDRYPRLSTASAEGDREKTSSPRKKTRTRTGRKTK